MRVAVTRRGARGFSLVEMVIAITLLGIVSVTIGAFMLPAINAHQAVERRAALIDATESALRRMSRDIRLSLPNSVRITATGTGFAIELIPTLDGGKYCDTGTPLANCAGVTQLLDFTVSDTDFDLLGCFRNVGFTGATFPSTAYRLVIGDASGLIYSASGSPAVATPAGTSITLSTVNGGGSGSGGCGTSSGAVPPTSFRHHIAITGGHQFASQSSRQRVFIVETAALPVTYICDQTAQTLTRYAGYTIQASQPTNPLVPPLSVATTRGQVANSVTLCSATSTTPDVRTDGVVTLALALSSSGETVQLMHQVQVDNSQ